MRPCPWPLASAVPHYWPEACFERRRASLHLLDDRLSASGPSEELGVGVVLVEVVVDDGDEGRGRSGRRPGEGLVGQLPEPPLHEIEPGDGRRREVQVLAESRCLFPFLFEEVVLCSRCLVQLSGGAPGARRSCCCGRHCTLLVRGELITSSAVAGTLVAALPMAPPTGGSSAAPRRWSDIQEGINRHAGLGVSEGSGGRSHDTHAAADEPLWARHPKHFWLDGELREFHLVGALAEALGRTSQTIRWWERTGVLPPLPCWTHHIDPRARRRLYLREIIEGVVRIAAEEGVLHARPAAFRKTRFPQRCFELYGTILRETGYAGSLNPFRREHDFE